MRNGPIAPGSCTEGARARIEPRGVAARHSAPPPLGRILTAVRGGLRSAHSRVVDLAYCIRSFGPCHVKKSIRAPTLSATARAAALPARAAEGADRRARVRTAPSARRRRRRASGRRRRPREFSPTPSGGVYAKRWRDRQFPLRIDAEGGGAPTRMHRARCVRRVRPRGRRGAGGDHAGLPQLRPELSIFYVAKSAGCGFGEL